MMPLDSRDPQELAHAIQANHDSVYTTLTQNMPGAIVDVCPNLTVCCTGLPHPALNMVLGTRLQSETVESRIRQVIDFYRSRHVPMSWMVTDSCLPDDLGDYLIDLGLAFRYSMPGMALYLDDLPPHDRAGDYHVREVVSKSDLADHCRIVGGAFGLNLSIVPAFERSCQAIGWGECSKTRHFIAESSDGVIGASTLALSNGVAGIYSVATRPDWRGRGIGTAMTLYPLKIATDMLYRVAVLQASSMGLSMYRRMGFREYCRFDVYGLDTTKN